MTGITFLLAALRWKTLLRVQEINISFRRVLQVTLIGQFFNTFLLGTTGGDVIRVFYMAQAAPKRKSAAGVSVILDRVLGLIALIAITFGLTLFQYRFLTASSESHHALWLFYVIAAGVSGVLLLAVLLPRLLRIANFQAWEKKVPFHSKIEHLSEAFARNVRHPVANAEVLLISVGAHFLGFLAQYCIVVGLHLTIPLWTLAAVTGLICVLISIPISLGGFGVREGLFIILLAQAGVSKDAALAISLLNYGLTTIAWGLVGGLIHLRYRHPLPEGISTEPLL